MTELIEPVLYIDPQRILSRRCDGCGKEIYPPGWYCPRCGRDKP